MATPVLNLQHNSVSEISRSGYEAGPREIALKTDRNFRMSDTRACGFR